MSRLGIQTGSNPNDGQGDPLRIAMGKINSNFQEVYNTFGDGFTLTSYASTAGISTLARNLTGSPRINVGGILNTGITTTEHLEVRNITSTGIITALQFVGDGSQLENVVATNSGVEVLDENVRKGVAKELNFGEGLFCSGPDGVGRVTIAVTTSIVSGGGTGGSPLEIRNQNAILGEYSKLNFGTNLLATVNPVTGVVTVTTATSGLNISGIITATSFRGSGSSLTGVITSLVGYVTTGYVTNALVGYATQGYVTNALVGYATTAYVNSAISGINIPTNLNDLSDVNVGAPSTGQVLKWSGTEWQAASDAVASGLGISLSDLSVTISPAGINSLSYNSATGVFNFTPTNGIATVSQGLIGTPNINVNQVGIASYLTVSGVTSFYNNVHLEYDKSILIGNNNELQLYHNETNSYIDNSSGNNLIIRTHGGSIQLDKEGPELMGVFNTDGSVELYYDNNKKFETTSIGATVFGTFAATSYIGSGSSLTGLTGAAANTYGNSTAVPQIVIDSSGRITSITNVAITGGGGGGSSGVNVNDGSLVGFAGTIDFGAGISVTPLSVGVVTANVTYAPVAGYSTSSGVSTTSGYATSSGIATYAIVSGYSTSSGIATYSTIAGYSTSSGISTYATTSGVSTTSGYATSSGIATYAPIAGYSTSSGIATYATTAGISTTSGYATSSGIATYATTAGISTTAGYSTISGYSTSSGVSTTSGYATSSGIATYASISGYSTSSGVSTTSGYATSSGIATYSTISGYSTSSGIATYATTSGVSTSATSSGYATTAGISTISQGLTGTPNINVGIITAVSAFVGSGVTINSGGIRVGVLTATSLVKSGGTSSQFLKADGSVDSNAYLTTTGSGSALTGIVTSIVAGTNVTISGSTGQVTINASGGGGAGIGTQWVTVSSGIYTGVNVGIGTTIVSSTLTVEGTGRFSGVVTASRFDSVTTGTPIIESSDTISINAPKVAISTDLNVGGNVSIGATITGSKLSVNGGDLRVGVNTSYGLILTSPNGTKYRLVVDNSGNLSTVLVP